MAAKPRNPVVLLAVRGEALAVSVGGALWRGDTAARAAGPPTAAAFSADGGALAVAADPKALVVLACCGDERFRTVLSMTMPKRLAVVAFTPDGTSVLAADRFGDVYLIPVPSLLPPSDPSRPAAPTILPDDTTPLMGHFSTITDLALTQTRVATADRENRVRVSHYPRSYDIVSFCLGHTAFVTRLCWAAGGRLLSGGGDGTVRLWDADAGVEVGYVEVPRVAGSDEEQPVVAGLAVCKLYPDLAFVLVHGRGKVLALAGIAEGALRVCGELELGGGQRDAGAGVVTAVVFDDAGLLWVSTRDSMKLVAYKMSEDGSAMEAVRGVTVDMEGVERDGDTMVATPGEWLSSLRKGVYDPEWKGKKRKRGGDGADDAGQDAEHGQTSRDGPSVSAPEYCG